MNDKILLARQYDLHFAFMGTCHKLLDEVRDFFHSENSLEILVKRQNDALLFNLDHLPLGGEYSWLQPRLIRKLRVCTIVNEEKLLLAVFQWDQLHLLVNLEEVQVGMFLRRRDYGDLALPTFRDSILLNGIVKGITELVSPNVKLTWGPWDTLPFRPDGTLYTSYYGSKIPAETLRDIAVNYGYIRGRKLKNVSA